MAKKGSLLEFTDNEFLVNFDDLQMGPQVGSGHFSTVHIGRYFGDLVAVKKQTRNTKALERYLVRELAALKTLKHQNLVEFIGACNIPDPQAPQSSYAVYMVTEYCEGGDLLSLILGKVPLSWKFRMRVVKDAFAGLHYLHSKDLIHRDIKSSNLLLDRQWRCKIADFGMVRDLSNQRMTICGTDEYMATELFLDEDYSTPVDMFSMGIVLLEVIARKKAGEQGFAHRQAMSLFALDAQVTRNQLPPDAPPSLVELAIQCCDTEPGNRPDAEAALAWIDDLYNTTTDDGVDPPLPSTPEVPATRSSTGPSRADMVSTDPSRSPSTSPCPNEAYLLDTSMSLSSSTMRSTIKSLESTAAEPTDHSGAPAGVHKEGWLHKRNSSGFRTWRRRYVVLNGAELAWYDQPNGEIKGHVDLAGFEQVIRDKRSCRWAVLDPTDPSHRTKEFAATSSSSMQRWMTAINVGIGVANRGAVLAQLEAKKSNPSEPSMEEAPLEPPNNPPPSGPMDLPSFLQSLKLEHLLATFEERGYNDLQMLLNMGLRDEDLDYLAVEQPLTRRYLKSAFEARCPPTDRLEVSLLGHTQLGDTLFYKLRSQWRFYRSVVYLSYDDVKALHADLKAASNEISPPPELPPLPAKHNLKASTTFFGKPGDKDKGKLVPIDKAGNSPDTAYFTALAALVSGGDERKALLNTLLTALELQHK